MKTGVLSRLSKFGFQIEGDTTLGDDGKQKWYNLSKYEKGLSLDGLQKGDRVDYDHNNKFFITKLAKSSGVANAPESGSTTPYAEAVRQPLAQPARSSAPSATDLRITRLSALSSAVAAMPSLKMEGDSLDDLVERVEVLAEQFERFAVTGSFEAPKPAEPVEGVPF